MVPLLIMPHNQRIPIQRQRHLAINRLLRALFLERHGRFEDVVLRQVEDDLAVGGGGEHVAPLGGGGGEEFGHAVELRADAVEAGGYADGIVEGGGGGVVRVGGLGGLELVEEEDIVDDALLVDGGLGGCVLAG